MASVPSKITDIANFIKEESTLDSFWQELLSQEESLHNLKELDIPSIRAFLDDCISLRSTIASKKFKVVMALTRARSFYEDKKAQVIKGTRDIDLASGPNQSSMEREAHYNLQLLYERHVLQAAESLLDHYSDLLRHLDKVYSHWDNRRVDIKWEFGRISAISGGDYQN